MLDELWRLIQFCWGLAAPALGQQSDAVLVATGIGLAILLTVGVAAAVAFVAVIVVQRATSSPADDPGLPAAGPAPRPWARALVRVSARPRAPGAALV